MTVPIVSRSRCWLVFSAFGAIGTGLILVSGCVKSEPKLVMPSRAVNFGAGKPGELFRGHLDMRNGGGAPLEFQIIRSCNCAALSIEPITGLVEPGSDGRITVTCRLDENDQQLREMSFAIKTNDPLAPAVRCSVVAGVEPRIRVTPSTLEWGTVLRSDQMPSAVVAVESTLNEDLDIEATSDHEAIRVSRVDERHYAVSVTPDVAVGDVCGAVKLNVGGTSVRELAVPVHVYIASPVTLAPRTVILSPEGDVFAGSVLAWSNSRVSLGRVAGFEGPPGIVIKEVETNGGERRRLKILSDRQVTGRARVDFRFEGVAEPVGIVVLTASPSDKSQ